uniref:Uncharacterized protein n=1 Tax=Streptomyces sp. NBC_00003 TaxID=2903608 RepID=A0AAU2V1B0_9ACTN
MASGKVTDFAGEAAAADAGVLRDCTPMMRAALNACLVHKARRRARYDLTTMFTKRITTKVKKAKEKLEEIRECRTGITPDPAFGSSGAVVDPFPDGNVPYLDGTGQGFPAT